MNAINVDLTGVTTMRLVVTDGGDNNYFDHTDWADAKLTCNGGTGGGARAFGAATTYATATHTHAAAVGDLNADGKNDIGAANAGSNTISGLLGDGSRGFGAPADFA